MKIIALTSLALIAAAGPVVGQDGSAEAAGDATQQPKIERLPDASYRFGEIRFRKDTKEISFPATVNMNQDYLEYALVHENGKLHESLLATPVSPYHLQVVLLLCGYKGSPGDLFDRFRPPAPEGSTEEKKASSPPDRVLVSVEWESGGGKKSARIEDWILNVITNRPMSRGHWAYTGSIIIDSFFQAEVEGSILAIYLDELALGNYPGPGNDRDDIWTPLTEELPPLSSDVTVVFRPAPKPSTQSE